MSNSGAFNWRSDGSINQSDRYSLMLRLSVFWAFVSSNASSSFCCFITGQWLSTGFVWFRIEWLQLNLLKRWCSSSVPVFVVPVHLVHLHGLESNKVTASIDCLISLSRDIYKVSLIVHSMVVLPFDNQWFELSNHSSSFTTAHMVYFHGLESHNVTRMFDCSPSLSRYICKV